MPKVIPKWKAHAVRDWEDLLIITVDGGTDLNAATAAILNYMPIIGITELTEESGPDAWCRIAIHQALFGSLVKDPTTGQSLYITKSDVLRHVGIETEGTSQSFVEFCSSIHRRAQNQDDSLLPSFMLNGGNSLLQLLGLTERDDPSGLSQ
jgi:hypothetical protein